MADTETPTRDAEAQGGTPDKTVANSTQTQPTRDAGVDERAELKAAIARERAKTKEVEAKLLAIESAKTAETQKALEEQGQFKQLFDNERKQAETLKAQLEAANVRWREAQTSSALASALGSQVADGSSPHVMAALAPALSVGDDGAVAVDMAKVAAIRSAKALDTTKIKDISTLVSAFLESNPFFAASRVTGGAGSGGIGTVNGGGSFSAIYDTYEQLSPSQQDALWSDPAWKSYVATRHGSVPAIKG